MRRDCVRGLLSQTIINCYAQIIINSSSSEIFLIFLLRTLLYFHLYQIYSNLRQISIPGTKTLLHNWNQVHRGKKYKCIFMQRVACASSGIVRVARITTRRKFYSFRAHTQVSSVRVRNEFKYRQPETCTCLFPEKWWQRYENRVSEREREKDKGKRGEMRWQKTSKSTASARKLSAGFSIIIALFIIVRRAAHCTRALKLAQINLR